ncbi:hypothetical protein [Streptomyces sp. Ag109_O5-1]|uniref:hypothetical protein n=1 Tax=Streptomyces sp. Ag109_O5-1 TaxID=1938851 RepID=UPI001628B744|nr:hypothetical protein [Streptomyces sp. Ag109_O5-1]
MSPLVVGRPVRRRRQWHVDVVRASLVGDVGGTRAWKRRSTSFVDASLTAVGTEVLNRP